MNAVPQNITRPLYSTKLNLPWKNVSIENDYCIEFIPIVLNATQANECLQWRFLHFLTSPREIRLPNKMILSISHNYLKSYEQLPGHEIYNQKAWLWDSTFSICVQLWKTQGSAESRKQSRFPSLNSNIVFHTQKKVQNDT